MFGMDLTPVFKKIVFSVNDGDILAYGAKNCLDTKNGKDSRGSGQEQRQMQIKDLTLKARKLVQTISKMKNFLIDHRKDYINLYSPLLSQASSMSDDDRDRIDTDVYHFMKSSKEIIKALKAEINLVSGSTTQAKSHHQAVLELIEKYLKVVCDIYSEQKAIRVKRACDKQKLSRLETTTVTGASEPYRRPPSRENLRNNSQSLTESDENPAETAANGLSVEELQTYEQENEQLYEELNAMTDEVRQLEGKVVEIARLQEIFTEKVLQQDQDLNRVNMTVINTTEDIRGGNEELRKAMKENAGFRVWILFYIITLTFTVLFLDWYNP